LGKKCIKYSIRFRQVWGLSEIEVIIGNKILIDQRKISKVGDSMTRLEPN